LPAALIGNFKDELISQCPGENVYITQQENNKLKETNHGSTEYKEIMKKVDERIEKYYTIYSYHKFVELVQENKIKLKNTVLIIHPSDYDRWSQCIEEFSDFSRKMLLTKAQLNLNIFLNPRHYVWSTVTTHLPIRAECADWHFIIDSTSIALKTLL
jgi:hypothetical protein